MVGPSGFLFEDAEGSARLARRRRREKRVAAFLGRRNAVSSNDNGVRGWRRKNKSGPLSARQSRAVFVRQTSAGDFCQEEDVPEDMFEAPVPSTGLSSLYRSRLRSLRYALQTGHGVPLKRRVFPRLQDRLYDSLRVGIHQYIPTRARLDNPRDISSRGPLPLPTAIVISRILAVDFLEKLVIKADAVYYTMRPFGNRFYLIYSFFFSYWPICRKTAVSGSPREDEDHQTGALSPSGS